MRRPILPILLAAGLVTAAPPPSAGSATAPVPHDHLDHVHEGSGGSEIPENRPRKGLIYDGLRVARAGGPCDLGDGAPGMFEMRHAGRFVGCTHGPDPAPAGVDAREADVEMETAAASATNDLPCDGDGVTGYRTQAIYAYRSSQASRFKTVAPLIRGWAADIVDAVFDNSAAKTGGDRHVRFVTDPGTCRLDIDVVPMPDTAVTTMGGMVSFLENNGYAAANRKYLVWMDANIYCGIAELYGDDRDIVGNYNNGPSFIPGMIARVDTGCWGRTGSTQTPVEAHELMHNLGGVQDSAPNSTYYGPGTGGHCKDEYDVMCYDDDGGGPLVTTLVCGPASAHRRLFDCSDDDYFHTSPAPGSYLDTHWNTADNRFLLTTDPTPVVASPPSNDDFASAQGLAGLPATGSGTNAGATKETGEPSHAGNAGGASVWFRWTAPQSGPVNVSTSGSAIDSLVAVYGGTAVDGLGLVAANDDRSASDLTSLVAFDAVAGTEYPIAVDGYAGDIGAVSLQIASPRGPIRLASSRKRLSAGRKVRLTATLPGCDAGDPVRVVGGGRRWTKSLGDECRMAVRARLWKTSRFRAIDTMTGDSSRRVKVRVTP